MTNYNGKCATCGFFKPVMDGKSGYCNGEKHSKGRIWRSYHCKSYKPNYGEKMNEVPHWAELALDILDDQEHPLLILDEDKQVIREGLLGVLKERAEQ